MADYTSGAIYFTGLGNGTDFDSIIEASVSAESVRLNQLTDWEEYWQEKSDALDELNTSLVTLRTELEGMDSISEFATKTASSTDTSAMTVTADGDAVDGTHTIDVEQLAQNDIWTNSSTGHADVTDSITSVDATFSYTYAGESYTVDVPAGTTLQGFENIINANPDSKADVRATILNDGDEYRIQIYGMDMGEDNTVSIDASTTLTGYTSAEFENTQVAQSALLKVDGYPSAADEWIKRDTNSFDDIIDGVTMTLHEPGDGIRITVGTDDDAIKDKIVSLVESINEVRIHLQELTYVDEDGSGSVMTGNYGVDMVEQNLKNITASKGLGFSYYDDTTGSGDYFSSLSQLGISTDADESSETYGQLVIDEEELDEALDEDVDAVISLFGASEVGESNSSNMTYVSSVDGMTSPGEHEVEYEIVGGAIISATINGEEASISGDEITGAYGTAAEGMTIRVDNFTDGSYTGTINVKQGKVGELADELARLTDSESGILVIIEDNYDEIIATTQESITQEEDRLTTYESRLREQYASLEAILSSYASIEASLTSQIDSLGSFS